MPGHYWCWFVVALLSAPAWQCPAASPPARHSIRVWTTDRGGLPQNSVISITQTRDGYLWLGTINGLARFDGVHFQVYDESNTPDLDASPIVRLFEDSQRRLWVAAKSGRILIVQPDGTIRRTSADYPGPDSPGGSVAAFCETTGGDVWYYTADGRLARYRDSRFDVWSDPTAVSSLSRMLFSEGGPYLVLANERSLTAYGPMPLQGTQLTPAFEIREPRIDLAFPAKDGGYWLLANDRVQRWSTNKLVKDFGAYPWRSGLILSAAAEDGAGNLFVGTYGDPGDGVWCVPLEGEPWRLEGLSHPSILSLLTDREGSLWVGTDGGGLNRVRPLVFSVVDCSDGWTVQSVTEDPSGAVWIAYNGDRIDSWKDGLIRQYTNILGQTTPQQEIAARSVLSDTSGNLWVGIQTRPVQHLSPASSVLPVRINDLTAPGLLRLENDRLRPVAGFEVANQQVSAIFQDKQGTIWVGTKGGAAYLRGTSWKALTTLDGLSANTVQCIAEDTAGRMWLGTERGGLNCLEHGKVTTYTKTNGLPSDSVLCLLPDESDVLWAGTAAGLARFDGVKWTAYTTREGLAANAVGYLIDDKQGYLWLGSSAGLMRVAKQALNGFAQGTSQAVSVRTYGQDDGLPTRECSRGSQPAACRTRDGRLWFPTIKGLAVVDPAHIARNPLPPPVVLESVLVDGRLQSSPRLRAPALTSLVIPAGRESLEIQYAALSLSASGQTRFRFRLENHESSWSEGTGSSGTAHYTRLPQGSYLFRLQACNEDDVWNLTGASLAITVLPPFWQTWWFITAMTMLLLAAIVGSVHYVSTQKLQRQLASLRQQEALEKERARIARDLHDQLGANLTQVALLGELAEADKELPQEVESHARQISQTARETTRALDEIVWTVNPANDTLDGLINYICKYAQEYLALAGLRYRIEVPPSLPAVPISPELRHNAFLAAKEAVNNVVKHSGASSAWLRLHLEPTSFTLEITDDGKGLPAGAAAKGRNGLKNMRKRMEEVGGSFSIGPGSAGGTVVRLSAPFPPLPSA
jgi:signal transduction histidine kinase/ligand-binding sensor domain-containing protein